MLIQKLFGDQARVTSSGRSEWPRYLATWLFCFNAAALFPSCDRILHTGTLRVASPTDGNFEIFRVSTESPLQFVAEQIGSFNKDIQLSPGSYLILADCSSQSVVIRPDAREELRAYEVRFETPREA